MFELDDGTEVSLGRLYYCNAFDTDAWVSNSFMCPGFMTGAVKDNKFVVVPATSLDQGDIVCFSPPAYLNKPVVLSVVHGVSPNGRVYLGNIHISPGDIYKINELHLRGLI